MHIAILESDRPDRASADRFGSYADLLEGWLRDALPEARFSRVHVAAGEPMPAPEEVDAILLTGARHSAYDPLPWIDVLKDQLRSYRDAGVPLGGVCFGHQVMAEAFGGRVGKGPEGLVLGNHAHRLSPEVADLFDGREAVAVLSIHQDQVLEVPPAAKVAMSTPDSPHGGLIYDFPALSVQFHPEFYPAIIRDVADNLLSLPPESELRAALQEDLDAPTDGDIVAEAFARFYRRHVTSG